MAITIRLPFPPSVNDMFLNNRGRGKGRIPSSAYRAWKEEAGWMLKAQHIKPHIGSFRLVIQLDDRRNGDCDNRVKPLCDFLVTQGIIQGDQKKYMRGLSVDWSTVEGCIIHIES